MQESTTPGSDESVTDVSTTDPSFHARRGALYGIAATALTFPDAETLADLRDDAVQSAVRAAAAEVGGVVDDAESASSSDDERALSARVDAFFAALDAADDDAVETAYNGLFGLPSESGSYPVVPYEAQYATTGDVNETQRRVATVVGLLERFDLEPHDGFDERQDHVAVLLELAQVMATQRAVALEDGDTAAAGELAAAEATVLDEHLLGFVPALAHDVRDATSDRPGEGERVYEAAAALAATLVQRDASVHPEAAVVDDRPAGTARADDGGDSA